MLATLIERSLPELAETERPGLIGLAEGSIGRAMDLAAMGGLALCREMIGLLATAPAFDVARLHGFADQAARDDRAFTATAGLFPWWLARMIRRGRWPVRPGRQRRCGPSPGKARPRAVCWRRPPLIAGSRYGKRSQPFSPGPRRFTLIANRRFSPPFTRSPWSRVVPERRGLAIPGDPRSGFGVIIPNVPHVALRSFRSWPGPSPRFI